MGRTNRPGGLAALDSVAWDSAWGTRVAPASNVPVFFRKLRRSMFSPWDRGLRARLDHSFPQNALLHGSWCRNCLPSIDLWRSADYQLSRCRLVQLFDPSALEISFVPGTALQYDCRSPPATDQVHILFRDAPIGRVALFGK